MSNSQKSTNGIAISFIASLLGLVIAAILYQIKWNFDISSEQTISLWLIMLVFLFSIRLYFRVIFIDKFFNNIEKKYLRVSLILIVPLSALAGIIWTFFDFSEEVGTIFMIIYSLLLAIFSICITAGLSSNKKKKLDSYVSIIVDICTAGFWSYYIYYIIENPLSREITDGLQLIFAVFCIAITFEFSRMYLDPLVDYYKYCLKILRNETSENKA